MESTTLQILLSVEGKYALDGEGLKYLRDYINNFGNVKVQKITIKSPRMPKDKVDLAHESAKEALSLSSLLYGYVIKNYPWMAKNGEKKIVQWAHDIDKINRIDKFNWGTIELVIKWSQEDSFWRKNILSGAKLRKQFDKLLVNIKEEKQEQAQRSVRL